MVESPNLTKHPPHPDEPCYICGSNTFWWRSSQAGGGDWLCIRCHPQPVDSEKKGDRRWPITNHAHKQDQHTMVEVEAEAYPVELGEALDLPGRLSAGGIEAQTQGGRNNMYLFINSERDK